MFTEAGNIILGYKLKAHQVIHITTLRPSMLRGKLFKLMVFEDFIKDWDLLFSRYVLKIIWMVCVCLNVHRLLLGGSIGQYQLCCIRVQQTFSGHQLMLYTFIHFYMGDDVAPY